MSKRSHKIDLSCQFSIFVSRLLQGCLSIGFRLFQECFRNVSRVFQPFLEGRVCRRAAHSFRDNLWCVSPERKDASVLSVRREANPAQLQRGLAMINLNSCALEFFARRDTPGLWPRQPTIKKIMRARSGPDKATRTIGMGRQLKKLEDEGWKKINTKESGKSSLAPAILQPCSTVRARDRADRASKAKFATATIAFSRLSPGRQFWRLPSFTTPQYTARFCLTFSSR